MAKKVEKKIFDQTLLLIVNDFQGAKETLNERAAASPNEGILISSVQPKISNIQHRAEIKEIER